jgi:rod shape-determining protein MreB
MDLFKNISQYLSCQFAVDIGASKTVIIDPLRGKLIDEPSLVVVKQSYGYLDVVAIGSAAQAMIGKVPRDHKVIFPIQQGRVVDFDVAEVMVSYFFDKALSAHPNRFFKPNPKVCASVPVDATPVDKSTLKDLILKAGASSAYLVEQPLAAAIGADIDIEQEEGNMLIHMGATMTEMVVLSMGDIVVHKTIPIGGDVLTDKIIEHFSFHHKIALSREYAEELKCNVIDAMYAENCKKDDYEGGCLVDMPAVDSVTNQPIRFSVDPKDAYKAIFSPLKEIINGYASFMQEVSPELAIDIMKNGIFVSGGLSQLHNLDAFLTQVLKVRFDVVEDPCDVVAKGCLEMLECF